MIDTIIFDLNNVAENYDEFKIEFEHHIRDVLLKACELLGCAFDENTLTELYAKKLSIINTVPFQHHPAFWQSLFEDYLKRNLYYSEIAKIYDSYLCKYSEIIDCYPDFIETIGICKSKNLKIGIIANGNAKRIYRFLEKFNLIDKFDTIVASGFTPFSKPNPAIFELAVFNLKSLPLNTIFVGDRLDTDILGSNRIGIWSVHLLRGSAKNHIPHDLDHIPDFSIENLKSIFSIPLFKQTETVTDVVIPCGGRGKRMGNLSKNSQKCMLPSDNTPILKTISKLMEKCGLKTIHFLLGHNSHEIKDFFSKLNGFSVSFRFHEAQKESTGQALYSVLNDLPESFFYCHGNILFPPSLVFKLQKKYYTNNHKSTFVTTTDKTAETHPVFALSNGNVIAIERYDRDIKDNTPFYSMGFALINKTDIFHGVTNYPESKITTEQLFARSFKKVDTLNYKDEWYHLENQDDLLQYKSFLQIIESNLECLN